SFQYRFSIGDGPASPHRASVVFLTAPLPGSRYDLRRGSGATRASVEAVLRHGKPVTDQRVDGFRRPVDPDRDVRFKALADLLEHVVGRILSAGGPADPDADAVILRRPQRRRQRLQAVVPAAAAAELHVQLPRRDLELV